jgi:hypothetical protein
VTSALEIRTIVSEREKSPAPFFFSLADLAPLVNGSDRPGLFLRLLNLCAEMLPNPVHSSSTHCSVVANHQSTRLDTENRLLRSSSG